MLHTDTYQRLSLTAFYFEMRANAIVVVRRKHKSWLNQESELVLPITCEQPSGRDRLTLKADISDEQGGGGKSCAQTNQSRSVYKNNIGRTGISQA